jgi:hypothetical protein
MAGPAHGNPLDRSKRNNRPMARVDMEQAELAEQAEQVA